MRHKPTHVASTEGASGSPITARLTQRDAASWHDEAAALRAENHRLLQRAETAERALEALRRVSLEQQPTGPISSSSPVSLQAAQQELRRNEVLLRAVFDSALDAMLLVDGFGRAVDANPAASELFGLPRAELLGRSITDFTPPGYDTAPLLLTLRSARRLRGMFPLQRLDGTRRELEFSAVWDVTPGLHLTVLHDVTERNRAEATAAAALQEMDRERRTLGAVLEALPVGVWIADACGRFTRRNPAAAKIWGGRAPAAADTSQYGAYSGWWTDSGQPLAAEDWGLARTLATGQTFHAEAVDIARFDGTRGHVLASSAPILAEDGTMVGGVAVVLDVSEQRASAREREALIESLDFERRRLGVLLEKAPSFIAVLRGPQHVYDYVNEAYNKLTGGRELLGRTVAEALPEIQVQGFIDLIDGVLRTGQSVGSKGVPIRLTNGPNGTLEQRYVDYVYQPMVEADGTRSGVFVHGSDVTEATLAQQRVRAQFHGIPVPTSVWQRVEIDGGDAFALVDANQAELDDPRGGGTARIGASAENYFADSPSLVAEIGRCLEEGKTTQSEIDRTLRDTGAKRRLFVTCSPAPPDLVLVHAEDITARIRLEEQLLQAQKMEAIGRLAGGVAHDFNNVLAVILSYADLAMDGLEPHERRREDIQQIMAAARRATDLTRQLLAFSRQQVLKPRSVDVNRILERMRPMLARLVGAEIELRTELLPDTGLILADPGQVEQVVMNLVVNARDAMPEGGVLTLETRNAELTELSDRATLSEAGLCSSVLLVVRDTGSGMDAATRARIFEPFFTTKATGRGTGLGLATVFGIVEQSGGTIVVESEPGSGSAFKVYLPRTDQPAPESVSPVRAVVGRGSETVLLVEDEEQFRRVAGLVLRRHGYRVLEASNGTEALEVASAHAGAIDLLLTDMSMPKLGGGRLAEELGPQHPDMKILIVSGYTDDALVRRGISTAGIAFLQKPFTLDTLLAKVREVLETKT